MKNKKVISIFLFISIVGLFLPWFFFDKDVDYTNGLYWLSYTPLLLISLFTSIIILLINKVSKTINVIFFLSSLLVSVSCIYLFFLISFGLRISLYIAFIFMSKFRIRMSKSLPSSCKGLKHSSI